MRIGQEWRPSSVSHRRRSKSSSSSSFLLRTAFLILLAFSIAAKASKGQDEGPDDQEVLMVKDADDRGDGDFEGDPAPGRYPIQYLRDFTESGDKDFGGRTGTEAKRKWSNNEYLRVWGKRNALWKLSSKEGPTGGGSNLQREMLRNGGQLGRDPVLFLYGLRRLDVRGNAGRTELEDTGRQRGTELQVFDDDQNFGSKLMGMGSGIPRPEVARPKRKWERNSLRIWGKRGETNPGNLNDRLMYTNMRRRKWENLPLRVWGK